MDSYRTQSLDTTTTAELQQFEIWAGMSAAEKLAAFLDLQATTTALAEAGIRLRHPTASGHEVFLRRVAQTLGEDLARRVYGWEDPGAG